MPLPSHTRNRLKTRNDDRTDPGIEAGRGFLGTAMTRMNAETAGSGFASTQARATSQD
jgi:hypothetical protein